MADPNISWPLERDHTGGTNVLADYRDPAHPHNGDIENQTGTPQPKGISKKHLILGSIVGVVLLAAIGGSSGGGYMYGKAQVKKPTGTPPPPMIVTASQPVSTNWATETKNVTTTVEKYIKPTITETITGLPTTDACLISGLFPTRDMCEQNCVGIGRRHETRCGPDGIGFRCHSCVFKDYATCEWVKNFDNFEACAGECYGIASIGESPHCVADDHNQFWHCYKCPMEGSNTVPFEAPVTATSKLPSKLPPGWPQPLQQEEATPMAKETQTGT